MSKVIRLEIGEECIRVLRPETGECFSVIRSGAGDDRYLLLNKVLRPSPQDSSTEKNAPLPAKGHAGRPGGDHPLKRGFLQRKILKFSGKNFASGFSKNFSEEPEKFYGKILYDSFKKTRQTRKNFIFPTGFFQNLRSVEH
jgi:hypothetical protein